ncbi:hypothetical protein PtA15_4A632 [Puccinia triticina]|uniref:Cyclin-dependent kinase 8 n=2 Tax=Puccinia triticina TaxID=208348 RepID=A0ABY7CHE3_9BASI|nr:uncharacterized protein PtA15_4A632 [Puccinia triticina]WAQ84180.1 hypothetical protein PtA15_4A632 [Puccinia triticina]
MQLMQGYRERKDRERRTIQDRYAILGFISSGTYGKVYKARPRDAPGAAVAIKKFKPDRDGEASYTGISQSACREIMLNREIGHENLTALQEVMLQDKAIYLVFEYCEHDFLQIIHHHSQTRSAIPEPTLKALLFQLLNGLAYLHANWIVHRDLKPANILVTERGVVKIGDLGLARSFHSPIQSLYASDKVVVTIWYRAPELLLGARHYSPAIDVWSVGCILGELLCLRPIFKGDEAKPEPHHASKKAAASGVPFQKDQLAKIFDVLGTPSKEEWPSIVHLPEYAHMARFDKTPSGLRHWYMGKTAVHARTAGGGGGQQEGFQLMSGLLRFEPARRLTAHEALGHARVSPDDADPIMAADAFRRPRPDLPIHRLSATSVSRASSATNCPSRPASSKRPRYD